MLSIDQCRRYLKNKNLTDAEVEQIRNLLYALSVSIIRVNYESK